MTIALSSEMEALVGARLRSGNYQSAEDVILKGLQLLEAQERKTLSLRQELQVGLDDVRAVRVTTIASESDASTLIEDIIRRGRERLQKKEAV